MPVISINDAHMGLCFSGMKLAILVVMVFHPFCSICFASSINTCSGSANFRSRRVVDKNFELCLIK